MKLKGKGTVERTFLKSTQTKLIAKKLCYHVPNCKEILFSPQQLFNKSKEVFGQFIVNEDQSILKLNDLSPLHIEYDSQTWLSVAIPKKHYLYSNSKP